MELIIDKHNPLCNHLIHSYSLLKACPSHYSYRFKPKLYLDKTSPEANKGSIFCKLNITTRRNIFG